MSTSTHFSPLGATLSKSFSQGESEPSLAAISPELFQAFTFFINQTGFGGIAWRKAVYDKKQVNPLGKDELTSKPLYNKNKFTGSPAFKELKNLIVLILTSQANQKGNS